MSIFPTCSVKITTLLTTSAFQLTQAIHKKPMRDFRDEGLKDPGKILPKKKKDFLNYTACSLVKRIK